MWLQTTAFSFRSFLLPSVLSSKCQNAPSPAGQQPSSLPVSRLHQNVFTIFWGEASSSCVWRRAQKPPWGGQAAVDPSLSVKRRAWTANPEAGSDLRSGARLPCGQGHPPDCCCLVLLLGVSSIGLNGHEVGGFSSWLSVLCDLETLAWKDLQERQCAGSGWQLRATRQFPCWPHTERADTEHASEKPGWTLWFFFLLKCTWFKRLYWFSVYNTVIGQLHAWLNLNPTSLVTICQHTKMLQSYWLYSLCHTFILVTNL